MPRQKGCALVKEAQELGLGEGPLLGAARPQEGPAPLIVGAVIKSYLRMSSNTEQIILTQPAVAQRKGEAASGQVRADPLHGISWRASWETCAELLRGLETGAESQPQAHLV